MKSKLLLPLLFLLNTICVAQTRLDTLRKSDPSSGGLSLGLSFSRNGTGDLNGYVVDIGYEYRLMKRFSFYNNLSYSVHSDDDFGYDLIPQSTANPFRTTKPLIFVTTGIQTTPTIFYAISDKESSKFKIGFGPVLRYQESSLPIMYSYSNGQDLNIENYYVIFDVQPKVFTVGYKFSVDYMFATNQKNSFSLKAFYQNDTNGDLIVGIGLTYAHRIKFF